jgi:hypothetical protein
MRNADFGLRKAMSESVEANYPSIKQARIASSALSRGGICHAIIGGTAVFAHVWEINQGVAHARNHVDILLNRSDYLRAKEALSAVGVPTVDLQAVGVGQFRDAIRFVWAGEHFKRRDAYPAPRLDGIWIFPSLLEFNCLTLFPLIAMKLSSNRQVDILHIQDLLESHLIDCNIERRLPFDLCDRLQHIKVELKAESLICS